MPDIDLSLENREIVIKPDRISRNSFWILLGLVSSSIISFVTIFFLTRYLGPELFGTYSLAMSVALLFLPLADLGLDLFMTREISANPSSLREEISKTLSAKIFFMVGFWLLTITTSLILKYPPKTLIYISLFMVSFLFITLAQTYVGGLRAIQKMKFESLSMFLGRFVSMLGVVILIVMKASLMSMILAHLVGSILNFTASVIFLKSQVKVFDYHFDLDGFKRRIAQAAPFGLTTAFVAIYYKIDTVILSKMTSEAVVGFYNGAYNFVFASAMMSTPLVVSLFPVLSGAYQNKREHANQVFHQGLKYSLLIGFPLGFGTILMAEPLVWLAYGEKFVDSIGILQIMAGSIPLIFITGMVGNSMGAVGFQLRVCVVTFISMVFNIVMNLILVPKYGADGAAMSRVLTELLRAIQLWFLLKGIFERRAFYDFIKICGCCLIAWAGFALTSRFLGAWAGAAVFAIVYAISALFMRLLVPSELKQIMRPSAGAA